MQATIHDVGLCDGAVLSVLNASRMMLFDEGVNAAPDAPANSANPVVPPPLRQPAEWK